MKKCGLKLIVRWHPSDIGLKWKWGKSLCGFFLNFAEILSRANLLKRDAGCLLLWENKQTVAAPLYNSTYAHCTYITIKLIDLGSLWVIVKSAINCFSCDEKPIMKLECIDEKCYQSGKTLKIIVKSVPSKGRQKNNCIFGLKPYWFANPISYPKCSFACWCSCIPNLISL